MATQPISFGLSSGPGRFGPDGGARLFNCFAEKAPEGAKQPWSVLCRPGLVTFATLTGGAFRGGLNLDGVGYVVNGTAVDKVEDTGVVTNIGAFAGSGPVFMARNRKDPNPQIALVSGGLRAYIEADVVANITDTDLPPPVSADTIGGYMVFAIESGRYFWTSIDDLTAINSADFASAEANPDGLNCVKTRGQEIILFGPKSVEFHALTGSSRTFDRLQNTTLDLGCLAGAAVQSLNGVPIFPASDGTVRRLNAYSPERISTHAVERSIDALEDKSAMTAFVFQMQGHQFYVLNSVDFTWACDLSTGHWQEWSTYQLDRWRAEGSLEIGNMRIVGDYDLAKLYELDLTAFDDAGEYLQWRLRSGPTGEYPNRFVADQLYLDMLVGVGLATGTVTDTEPQILLRTSNDDGRTWSSEMSRPLGAEAVYKKQVSFRNLGASGQDGMRFEITVSAAVARCLQGAALRYSPLAP
jgi:hypothetical protein